MKVEEIKKAMDLIRDLSGLEEMIQMAEGEDLVLVEFMFDKTGRYSVNDPKVNRAMKNIWVESLNLEIIEAKVKLKDLGVEV